MKVAIKARKGGCERNVGDVGTFEPYVACNKDADYYVGPAANSWGGPAWSACHEHMVEVLAEGVAPVSDSNGDQLGIECDCHRCRS